MGIIKQQRTSFFLFSGYSAELLYLFFFHYGFIVRCQRYSVTISRAVALLVTV
jgi:hypothetical protein